MAWSSHQLTSPFLLADLEDSSVCFGFSLTLSHSSDCHGAGALAPQPGPCVGSPGCLRKERKNVLSPYPWKFSLGMDGVWESGVFVIQLTLELLRC